jgi:uncharacterized membrane protein YbhN (UPF0104 family)
VSVSAHPARAVALASAVRRGRFLPKGWTDLWFQLALMSTFAIAYELSRVVVRGDRATAMAHAHAVVDRERDLGIFVELDVQRWVLHAPSLVSDIANWTYFNCQFTITFSVVLWVYLRRNGAYARLRNTLLAVDLIGLVGYLAYPAAPPRMLPALGFADTLNQTSVNHQSGAVAALSNPYAAMPSLHTAYALIIGLTARRLVRSRWLRIMWTLYPGLVVFSIIATGNHFVLDAAAGAAVAATAAVAIAAAPRIGRPPMPSLWTAGPVALGVLLVALCLWRLEAHGAAFAGAFESAAPGLVLVAIVANLISVALKATVWKVALESAPGVGHVPHRTLIPPLFVGFLCNSVLAFRVGDVARIADARRRLRSQGVNAPATVVAGSAIAEQLMLGLALVIVAATLALTVVHPPAWITLTIAAVAAGVAISTVVCVKGHRWQPRGEGRLARSVAALVDALGQARHLLGRPRAFGLAFAAAIGSWAFQLAGIHAMLAAVSLPHTPAADGAVFLASTMVGLVPLIPGNVGVFPIAVAAATNRVGIDTTDGLSFGLALQAVEVSVAAGLGLLFAVRSGIALRDLARARPDMRLVPAPDEPAATPERRAA